MRSSSSSRVARTSPARGSVSQVCCPDTPAPACTRQTLQHEIYLAARQLGFGQGIAQDADPMVTRGASFLRRWIRGGISTHST